MSHSIGMTGMDPQTGAALGEALLQAARTLGSAWRVVDDQEADYVIVDMDSMYGPMSWIRLHANGKSVIGLTSASRTQADFHLARPFDADSVRALLEQIVQSPGWTEGSPVASAPLAEPVASTPASPSAPAAVAVQPEPAPAPPPPPAAEPVPVPAAHAAPAPASAHDPIFADWMAPGALVGRFRYTRGDTLLLIDADTREYHGPATLKPLAEAITGSVQRSDFEPVSGASWQGDAARAGAAQPLLRLQWFAGLVAGQGRLLPGYDAQAKYRLGKWPQTEREFPKHFRIATVMMKAPATLAEIAEASGVALEEVTDFVNANLATGYAEPLGEQDAAPEPNKPGGLFGRLRGR